MSPHFKDGSIVEAWWYPIPQILVFGSLLLLVLVLLTHWSDPWSDVLEIPVAV